jgi:hypothetical protein
MNGGYRIEETSSEDDEKDPKSWKDRHGEY